MNIFRFVFLSFAFQDEFVLSCLGEMNVLVLKKHLEFSAFQFQPLPSGGGGKERESGKKNPLSLLLLPPSSRKVRNGFPLLLPPHTFFLNCPVILYPACGAAAGGEEGKKGGDQPSSPTIAYISSCNLNH